MVCCLFWMLFDCLMIVVRTLFIYTHAQKHISAFRVHWRFRHAHKRNFLPQLKCSRLGNKSWQSDCSNGYGTVSSDTVHSCADDFRWGTAISGYSSPIRGSEVRFCLLNFPHQACRGKLEDKEILCFLLNFPHQAWRGKLEDKEILCFQLNFPRKFRRQKRMQG